MLNTLASIGNQIKLFRIENGLSQQELSNLSGVDRAQLSRIEAGEVMGVTYLTIEKLLNPLGKIIKITSKEEKNEPLHIRPFVKWAGGKTQLLGEIEKRLPKEFNAYYEPFVGGGALLFKLQPKEFVINDLNKELIDVYKCFKHKGCFDELKEKLKIHENNHSEEYFYKIREEDKNELFELFAPVDKAARLIYLNKSCFNGLYRVNSKGYFNVPFGKKDKVICFDRINFENLFLYFKNNKSKIMSTDFEKCVKDAKKGDFVYFDPPYDKYENKNNFVSYSKESFDKKEQIRLANTFKELSDRGVYVMLSNHNTEFIRNLYKDFKIDIIKAKRMINSKGDGRGDVEEVIITNY